MKVVILGAFLIFSANSLAKNTISVNAIGSSPKGQFVAFEEFGYIDGIKAPFSLIRVKNVWKDSYVDQPIRVVSEKEDMKLDQVRAKAKRLARERLKEFNIST